MKKLLLFVVLFSALVASPGCFKNSSTIDGPSSTTAIARISILSSDRDTVNSPNTSSSISIDAGTYYISGHGSKRAGEFARSYDWTVIYNGSTRTGSGELFQFNFNVSGIAYVTLKAIWRDGETIEKICTVTVNGGTSIEDITVHNITSVINHNGTFDFTLYLPDGRVPGTVGSGNWGLFRNNHAPISISTTSGTSHVWHFTAFNGQTVFMNYGQRTPTELWALTDNSTYRYDASWFGLKNNHNQLVNWNTQVSEINPSGYAFGDSIIKAKVVDNDLYIACRVNFLDKILEYPDSYPLYDFGTSVTGEQLNSFIDGSGWFYFVIRNGNYTTGSTVNYFYFYIEGNGPVENGRKSRAWVQSQWKYGLRISSTGVISYP